MGSAYQAMGDTEKAKQSWREASDPSASQAAANPNQAGGPGGPTAPGANGQVSGRGSLGGVAAGGHVDGDEIYYQAMALEKLGENDRAAAMFQQLIDKGTAGLSSAPGMEAPMESDASPDQRVQAADAHYLIGLGQLGLNNMDKARQEFALALGASPDHFAATMALAGMQR
jgi:tetratricopeptide (TPR) repeat protein